MPANPPSDAPGADPSPPSHPKRSSSSLGFRPTSRQPASADIILQFEKAIFAGRISVGDRLPSERELADSFGVSRPIVRESLSVLEAFGIVSRRRGRGIDSGVVVTSAGDDGLGSLLRIHVSLMQIPLRDLLEMREELERWAAKRAAVGATESQMGELRAILADMEQAPRPEDFLRLDTEFHLAIARASGNTTLTLLMGALRESIAQQMVRAARDLDDWPSERTRLLREHQGIARLIGSRNGTGAARAVGTHIRTFYANALADDRPTPRRRVRS